MSVKTMSKEALRAMNQVFMAIWGRHPDELARVLADNPGLDLTTLSNEKGDGVPPVIAATRESIYMGSTELLDALLAHGADPDVVDADGEVALRYAAMNGGNDVIRSLHRHGADINWKNQLSKNALHFAVVGNESDEMAARTVDLLLSLGCDPHLREVFGKTPLDLAKNIDAFACVDVLQKHLAEESLISNDPAISQRLPGRRDMGAL